VDQLDAIDNALNVQNGVLDLAAQTFVAHSPVFRLTKLARACYDPDAKCPKWDATVELFLPDEELREWVQMALGYSMLGRHSEWLFIPYGSGANGKSTILGAVRHALGEYACEAAPELLTERREQSPSSDSARAGLRGRRFVTTVETGRSKRLAEVLMKVLTGEPVITGKYMGKDYFEFQNQTAVWLATNHKPVVQASDLGVWRRIRLIPFTTTLGEDEREDQVKVGDELKAEADGILLWLMEGLRKYQERGSLDPVPKAVAEANAEFKDEMSSLGEWLDECCTLGREEWAPRNKLRESYVEHCKQSGRYELNPANFNSELRALGIEKADRRVNGTQTRGWKGIGLNTEAFLKQVETT
jgi:putative DNA primase/helicase